MIYSIFMWRYGIVLLAWQMMAQTTTMTVVSAATYERGGGLAPGMIATAFSPVITETGGYSITVGEIAAATVAIAAGQASFVLPAGAADGAATIALRRGGETVATAIVRIGRVAPGIFTANSSGCLLYTSPSPRD